MTKPAAEEAAELSFAGLDYRCYLPRYKRQTFPHGSCRQPVIAARPLFPGYLFVADWHGWPERSVRGVHGLLRSSNGRIAELPHADIEAIAANVDAGRFDETKHVIKRKVGDAVTLDLGGLPLAAHVLELTDSGRAIVSVMLMSRATRLTVDQAKLA